MCLMREEERERPLFGIWFGLREIMEEGVQVQLDGRNPERASRMGILLIAGQLRTNRQIFSPRYVFFTRMDQGDCGQLKGQGMSTETRPVVYLPITWLVFADAVYEQ